MLDTKTNDMPHARRAYALAGLAGLLGSLAAIAGDAATAALRDEISLVENSISRVAAGDHAIIADFGLSMFALGMLAVAWALSDWKLGGRAYQIGTLLLAVCAIAVFVLAAWNGYNRKNADDFGLHMNLVYLLAALFAPAALLIASGLDRIHERWKRFSQGIGVLWIASGPLYFFTPGDLKGLFERATMMLIVIWIAAISALLIWRARREVRT